MLVRLITRDDAKQVAGRRGLRAHGAWVPHLAVAEASWVLASVYDRAPDAIATAVEMLLSHEHLTVQDAEAVAAAVAQFLRPRAGCSDSLLVEVARKAGYTPLGTFDRESGELDSGIETSGRRWRVSTSKSCAYIFPTAPTWRTSTRSSAVSTPRSPASCTYRFMSAGFQCIRSLWRSPRVSPRHAAVTANVPTHRSVAYLIRMGLFDALGIDPGRAITEHEASGECPGRC